MFFLDYVIMYSNGKQLTEVCDILSDRLFDQNVGVRLALYRIVANWMLNLHDRYSYFPKLVPFILTAYVFFFYFYLKKKMNVLFNIVKLMNINQTVRKLNVFGMKLEISILMRTKHNSKKILIFYLNI